MTVLPATLNLKVEPGQVLHFDSAQHIADAHGLIRGVPYDTAQVLIRDEQHPAREATAEELAEADEIDAAGELADSIFAALSTKFGNAEILDTGKAVGEHEDMVFVVLKDGAEIARGTGSELQALQVPSAAPSSSTGIELAGPAADTAPAPESPAPEADPSAAAPHDGEPLPETAAE